MECGVLNKMQWTFYPIILEWVWYFEKCQIISIDLHYKEEFDDLKMIPAWVKSALIRTGIRCFWIKKIDRIFYKKTSFILGVFVLYIVTFMVNNTQTSKDLALLFGTKDPNAKMDEHQYWWPIFGLPCVVFSQPFNTQKSRNPS